jgi:hypothetical protein
MKAWLCKRVSVYFLTLEFHFFTYIMATTRYIRWYDKEVCFVLDQHVLLDLYSASSTRTY